MIFHVFTPHPNRMAAMLGPQPCAVIVDHTVYDDGSFDLAFCDAPRTEHVTDLRQAFAEIWRLEQENDELRQQVKEAALRAVLADG